MEKLNLLKIYVDEQEKFNGKPLYEKIVSMANELGLAGATVFKGILGFGKDHHMHSLKILRLSENMPIVIEIIDTGENIKKLVPFLEKNLHNGFAAIHEIDILVPLKRKSS